MNAHQLIYTSCRRGRMSQNDGLQVFSFDETFPLEHESAIRDMFSYRHPALPPDVDMDSTAIEGLPKVFAYRKVSDTAFDIARTVYIGKDYMGPTGRYGNYLGHHLLFEDLDQYPAEYFASPDYRNAMGFDEVNNPEEPPFLPSLEAQPGKIVTTEAIAEFIQVDTRIDSLNKMIAALLENSGTRKRIVICDDQKNIIKWIAAVHYLLPLHMAKNVNFSTFQYNPTEGNWDIVGAVREGTYFQETPDIVLFDFINGQEPTIELDAEFVDFVEMGMAVMVEMLEPFHSYLAEEYPHYANPDLDLYGALAVFQLSQGDLDTKSLDQAFQFLTKYGSSEQRKAFLVEAIEHPEGTSLFSDVHLVRITRNFVKSQVDSADSLLELCLELENILLSSHSGDEENTIKALWGLFKESMLNDYPTQTSSVYRALNEMGGKYAVLACDIFTMFLKNPQQGTPREQFDSMLAVLNSPAQYPPYIDAYFKYATEPEERAYLLQFIMKHGIRFAEAETLVREAMSTYEYAEISRAQSKQIIDTYNWAAHSHLDIAQCGNLWSLTCGAIITRARDAKSLVDHSKFIEKTSQKLHLETVPSRNAEFLEWTVPHIVTVAKTAEVMYEVFEVCGYRNSSIFCNLVSEYPIKPFNEGVFIEIAAFIFMRNSESFTETFTQACRKLASKNLETVNEKITSTFPNDPEFTQWWSDIYTHIQTSGFRGIKNRLLKRKKDTEDSQE